MRRHRQVSIGQTWGAVKEILEKQSEDSSTYKLKAILSGPAFDEIDAIVTKFARSKHGKESEIKPVKAMTFLLNHIVQTLKDYKLGFFESMSPLAGRRKSKFSGRFRVAHGYGGLFSDVMLYEGEAVFSKENVLLINVESGRAINLYPFVMWLGCPKHTTTDWGHCYMFDKYYERRNNKEAHVEYVSVGDKCVVNSEPCSENQVLSDAGMWIDELMNGKGSGDFEIIENVYLSDPK